MFTGIIQAIGQVKSKTMHNKGAVFTFSSSSLDFSTVTIGDSIAVNGVCLTVIEIENESFTADVSQETLNCSIFGDLSMGDAINLEKALRLNQGIDGHLVSGHVDGQGEVTDKALEGESMRFRINVAQSLVKYIARKGSITVNGVSLTVNSIKANGFDINIVPHTLTATTLGRLNIGDSVNLEVDIIARHLEQLIKNK
ncbi:Riboflavin synthase eubacterial/eukaryotic (EC [Bathymodiolus thermophilus thioautotrophic gill symbiont]|jgi:riboflavin synthase|uniref:Riboflavin synthase eubacterial/eukaryotic (EC) n=3 Tax=sulfur-oxidizing symbionts TaxID=32036 RepID=A0ACA8ZS87_9GAMM|nr:MULTISPECIES: riboflavin synthase [sulfur-oxidizing symbionts]CAC9513404.1 Riboflavin synthase eubacterial/eukaryotic (EC 2.5.1.9) [uncultured Gammaproteobacteria bacterium]CAB5497585.1 Riboflavin synthase eubacterial/eukaryotic (EC [Bathymodiolus thermophilus thioautotrophic gill symbiont]CAB5503995.1 Riboflavin synthase eubacterial/eukaryotic (EC [Bathymodiolus azoricus thioautotrophic gill symbiont]CAC9519435.1 Riboflavin synthase eubacterial/eukaryotic (EC 2.5.1.9) [uncultured Gammaprote